MVFVKRAWSALVVLAILVLAITFLPSPISTVAGIILGGFVLLLLLPLLLAAIGMVSVFISDDDDGGWFSGIMDAWFMWSVLDWLGFALRWPWIVIKRMFIRPGPKPQTEEPPFNREA